MKALICWNTCTDYEKNQLENQIRFLLKKEGKSLELEFLYSKDEFDSKRDYIKNYNAIIVLCELTWNNKLYSNLYGIDFVKNEIRLPGINLPVLFMSFLSRSQILKLDSSKQIISTFALGHHFIHLPTANVGEIEKFYEMELVPSSEMEDTLNFISFDKIVSTIRHDVNSENIEECKLRLINIIDKANFDDKKQLFDDLGDVNNSKGIKDFCDDIEKKIPVKGDLVNRSSGGYNVLLLEDTETEEIKSLLREAKENNINITHCKKTSEAFQFIKDDTFNKLVVIIADFRIWDNPDATHEEKLMSEKQGYRFIEDVVKLGRRYTFVSFSELPRAFRMRIATSSQTQIIPEEKALILSSATKRKAFINKIIYWAEQTQFSFANKASKEPVFAALYNTFKNSKENDELNLTQTSLKLISEFQKAFESDNKIVVDNLFDADNGFATYLAKLKSNDSFEFKQEKFDLSTLSIKDINAFSNKLIMRRLVIYAYWHISEVIQDIYNTSYPEHITVIDEDKKKNGHYKNKPEYNKAITEFKRYFGVINIINTLLIQGYICKKFCYIRNEAIFREESRNIPAKASSITNKALWIHNRKNTIGARRDIRVSVLSDIGFTSEEETFFSDHFPDLFKKWKTKS